MAVGRLDAGLPQGRLAPSTGVAVPTTAVLAAASVFYTPYQGNKIPIYTGSGFASVPFTELSNVLANSATGSAGPAAAAALSAYDLFVWNNAGVLTLTRGPVWTYTASVTVTSAAPGVVTWTSHGLTTGMIVQFGGSVVPTGLSAATNYYITVVDANSFKVSTTMANLIALTYVTTSSTGTAVTSTCYGFSRGTGAGTTQLSLVQGVLVNTVAITNGPAAGYGTYVGSIYTDAGGATVSYDPGSSAAGGGTAKFNLWNTYNRVWQHANVRDSTNNYAYTTATVRPADNNANNSIQIFRGLQEDMVSARYAAQSGLLAAITAVAIVQIGLDNPLVRASGAAFGSRNGRAVNEVVAAALLSHEAVAGGDPGLGIHVIYAEELGDGTNANTFNSGAVNQLEADLFW